jgi:hypothetical protein
VILDVPSYLIRGLHFLIKPASDFSMAPSLGPRTLLGG